MYASGLPFSMCAHSNLMTGSQRDRLAPKACEKLGCLWWPQPARR